MVQDTTMIQLASRHMGTTIGPLSSSSLSQLCPEDRVRLIWRTANAVCFDVDSTVCQDEAIDEFARFLGVGDQVAQVTRSAMNGNAGFRFALKARLDIMRPTRAQLECYTKENPPKMTPGICELVNSLHKRNVIVYLVSGGFRAFINPVADILSIPRSNIFANEILFDSDGNYAGFDEKELTSDSGSKTVGKAGVVGLLKQRHNYRRVVMVGDGATDMEAAPPADAFIGFGGNQMREAVRSKADWYVMDFDTLREALNATEE